MNGHVLYAIFKRNFVSYFSNPTGYVFVCVFVLLSSFAAFWPNEFFNNNLADLDQLNKYLPYIMLVFIPAITMSIWAEERRQGTDELVLTIPAGDFDVVLGKYLAAVAIFTVSLVFSMLANLWVLMQLGSPDLGLFLGTYIGYGFVGLAMLAVGMVASFLTANLTVGFILGALFNAPLAFSAAVETIVKDPRLAQAVEQWSLAAQVRDFERGVISLSSMSYFIMIAVVMLYVSMVLIGRRHWLGGRDGRSMLGHYVVRTLSLLAVAVGVNLFFSTHDLLRLDITSARLSSLSPNTRKLITNLKTDHPVTIEAYVSPQVPAEFVQTRLNLLSTLDELKALGSGKVTVVPHVIENFSEQAVLAEKQYGIKPRTVFSKNRGARTQEDIFLAAAFTCGLDKVVLPFIDKGIPVEYELVRSICTAADPARKRLGVLKTDVSLFGSFNMQTMSPTGDAMIIEELKKQYDVVEVDPTQPINDHYDVLLAVQPSSLTPEQMDNFLAAVERGQPTAIFEDPFPLPNFYPNVPGTAQPRRPPQQMPFMMQRQPPPQPKGDIQKLWDLLGVRMDGDEIVWQDYNPYPKGREFITSEWVFIDRGIPSGTPFNDDHAISSNLQQVLFIFPGSWQKRNTSQLKFTPLAGTGDVTGTIRYSDIMRMNSRSPVGQGLSLYERSTNDLYTLAAYIEGPAAGADDDDAAGADGSDADEEVADGAEQQDDAAAVEKDVEKDADEADDSDKSEDADKLEEDADESGASPIRAVVVADIDCLSSAFFFVRAQGEERDAEISWEFDNVTFVLNLLDYLAGDQRFLDIRKRRRSHRTLTKLEQRTEEARSDAGHERQRFVDEFEKARQQAQSDFDKQVEALEKNEKMNPRIKAIQVQMLRNDGQRKLEIRIAQLEDERDLELKRIERNLALEVRRVQDRYKLFAVLVPPIPPLLLAFFVFFHRRHAEREGVAKSRLR